MAYPNNQAGRACNVVLNPTLHTGLLNGLANAAQAVTALDQLNGIQSDTYFLLTSGWRAISGAWAWVVAGWGFNGALNNVSNADGDAIEIEVRVPSAGTYTLSLATATDANCPIIKLFLDEVAIGVPAGYDLYSWPPDPVTVLAIAGLVLAAGDHKLKILVDGLNAAPATGWRVALNSVSLRRTA